MRVAGALAIAVVLTGCGDAFTSRVDAVAQADGYDLGVEPTAELIATGKGLPLRRDVVEGIAALWVDYVIFANRLTNGDSLLDSATVAEAMWAEIQQELASRYHDRLIGTRARLDSAEVDSVYAAGNLRLIKHVVFGVAPDASPEVRQVQRRLAEDVRRRLMDGAITWHQAVEATDDPATKAEDGSVGVVARGEAIPAFENAAFALPPGEFSAVVESADGYHVVYRPRLADVRDEFRTGVQHRLEDTFDAEYLKGLPDRWNIRVRSGIAPAVREVGNNPVRAKSSRKVLGNYGREAFRVSDFARWLQAMPVEIRRQLPAASDSQVTEMVRSLMRNEALLQEARDSGVTVSLDFLDEQRDMLRRQMSLMAALLGMPYDSLQAIQALSPDQRRTVVEAKVFQYLQALAQNRKRLQTVPPFLGDALRARADWHLVPAGVEQVLDRARRIRLALDTLPTPATPAPPPPDSAPVGAPTVDPYGRR